MLNWSLIFAAEAVEQKAVLLGFDATLPIIVIQFLLLMTVLKALFFDPLTKAIDDRNDYARDTAAASTEKLAEAKALAQQYKQEIAQTRVQTQNLISAAEAEATAIRNQKVIEAQQEAQAKVEEAKLAVGIEKQAALEALSSQVAGLSDQLTEKLLGATA